MKKSETAELNFQQQGRTELERNYKDTVFVTVFHEKEKLIELYNAIFDTNYDEMFFILIIVCLKLFHIISQHLYRKYYCIKYRINA